MPVRDPASEASSGSDSQMTANLTNISARQRISAEATELIPIWAGHLQTPADIGKTVFKTVGGVHRRPWSSPSFANVRRVGR